MPSIIAKRIAADISDGNATRARALVAYCARPEDEDEREKCVLFRTFGYSDDNALDVENLQDELDYTLSLTKYQQKELVSHWVLSWKDGTPTPAQAVDAARMLVSDLGYSETDHKITVAIHADTDNIHAHIVACRVHNLTGKLLDEGRGWWKNEAQKSLARIAAKHGWDLEKGARYRVRPNTRDELHITPDGEEVIRPSVARVKAKDKTMRPRPLKPAEEQTERHTGAESEQRQLQQALEKFFQDNAGKMGSWKAADLHHELARLGISCERVTHGRGRHGLVFSYGSTKFKASDLLHGLSYRSLLERIGGGWRDAREDIAPILAEARARRAAPAPTPKEAAKMTEYSKSIKDALRKIPLEKVFASLNIPPAAANRQGKPIKTAYDACFHAGQTYAEAVEHLATHFPEYVTAAGVAGAGNAQTDPASALLQQATAALDGLNLGNMGIPARKIATMMDALGVRRMDITTHVPAGIETEPGRPRSVKLEAATIGQIVKRLPLLAHLNALGVPGKLPVGIYCRPIWPEGKVGIMVDDAKPELAQEYPPTLELQTSAEGRPQAFYVVPRKYPQEFYDYAVGVLNQRYGDPAVRSTSHDTRLPGFQNQKRERASWVSIKSQRPGPCPEMEARLDKMYAAWRGSGKTANIYRHPQPDNHKSARLAVVDLPANVEQIGRQEQERLRRTYGAGIDRSRADWMVAQKLYHEGATPGQVYAFFRSHLMQAEGVSADGVPRIRSAAEHDRQARRLALRAVPTGYTGAGSDYWQQITRPEPVKQDAPPPPSFEQEREQQREELATAARRSSEERPEDDQLRPRP